MLTCLHGNIVHALAFGRLQTLPGGWMVLEDGVIRGVWETLPEEYADGEVVDYGDCLVMQSFADLHLHAAQYPMLGLGMDLPLLDWLHTYTFSNEERFADTDFARRTYRRFARQLIENGTTRVAVFASRHTDATLILMEELEKAGVTGFVGKVNMDRDSGVAQETTEQSKAETLRWLDGCRFDHIKPMLTPRFTPSCTDELMAWLGDLAAERDLPVQSHLSENDKEIELVAALCPDCDGYWQTYNKAGLWKKGTLMAHCVHSDKREQQAMIDAGVTMVHCANSNMNVLSGTAPVREMIEAGVSVALGSDIAGGDQLEMYRVIVNTIRASKIKQMETGRHFLTVPEAYYLGTTAGHRYFGAGAGFAPGDRLHAVVVDDSALPEPARPLDLRERMERAIYLMEKDWIRAVWSDGRCVVSR